MRVVGLIFLLAIGVLANVPGEENVNSRYTVEGYELRGAAEEKLSTGLRKDLQALIGQRYDQRLLRSVGTRLKRELDAEDVKRRILRGSTPEQVKVVFDVTPQDRGRFRFRVPQGVYHAKLGWTGALEGTVSLKSNEFTAGVVSDNEHLVERLAGVTARYNNDRIARSRVGVQVEAETLHQIWNPATLRALDENPQVPGAYRARHRVSPSVRLQLAEPLSLIVGASFHSIENQARSLGDQFMAARTDSANTIDTALRYSKTLTGTSSTVHRVDAGYELHAATRTLGSDYVYGRHLGVVTYAVAQGDHGVTVSARAGTVSGTPPLFERFVIGNSTRLRGWSKYDVNPIGGTRVVDGTVAYQYKVFEVFYDAGRLWNARESTDVKHGVGTGVRFDRFFIAVAFPLRAGGGVEPVFLAGLRLDEWGARR